MVPRLFVLLVFCRLVAAGELVFYVSPGGDDAWSGRLAVANRARTDGPFATLGRARDAIRQLKKRAGGRLPAPVTVLVRGGFYQMAEPLRLEPQDSGSPACPVTYAAYPRERPVLSGGVVIGGLEEKHKGILSARLPSVEAGEWFFRQLFVRRRGEGWWSRRYRPNAGPFVIAGLTNAPARKSRMRHRQSQDEFRFFPGDLERWENLADVEIVALHDWSASRLRIRELDLENHIVRFTGFPVYRIGHWFKGGRNPYFAENVKEQFKRPGQWYLDRPTGTLSYRLLPDERPDQIELVAPRTSQLLVLEGGPALVEHIRFRGLVFAHTWWGLGEKGYSSGQGMVDLPAAVSCRFARNCRLERCAFVHLGAYALRLGEGCHANTIEGCAMFDLGGGGVLVGVPDRSAAEPKLPTSNTVSNCVISDGGLVHYSAHGVWVGIAARTTIRHNVIRRFLYSTVSVGWSWNPQPTSCRENVLEWNHIHDAMMLLADGGGIYTLGYQPGTVIRGNHIHDVHRSPFAGRAPNNGIFFDQGSKGYLVERNVIYRCANGVIRFNQSRREWHTWRQNTFEVEPRQKGFPTELAARAGLEHQWRDVDLSLTVPPTPILQMSPPRR